MLQISLVATPAQSFHTVLGQQEVDITIRQRSTGLYIDVSSGGVALVTGKLCRDRVKLIRHAYLGFVGDLCFIDTQGASDPSYEGLGDRYLLVYLEASDL